jgi:hypothetical protein
MCLTVMAGSDWMSAVIGICGMTLHKRKAHFKAPSLALRDPCCNMKN